MFKKNLLFLLFLILSFNAFATKGKIDTSLEENNSNSLLEKETKTDPKNTLYIELKDGIVIAELFPKIAPMHVQRIRTLAADGFYDNVKFHRVIEGFMAQTGDRTGTGRGGSTLGRVYAEFNKEHHVRGTLSMARGSDVNSANSQFFIVTGDFFPQLDGQYTVFGRVLEGMEYVDKIKTGDTVNNGMVKDPDVMIKVLTGDMLNNKSIETIKEEIEIVNSLQAQKIKSNPNYKKKSILKVLLRSKDIDTSITKEENSSEVQEEKKNASNNNGVINNSETNEDNTNINNKDSKTTEKEVTDDAKKQVKAETEAKLKNENKIK